MIGSSRLIKVWVYPAPCDMRKQYDTLAALVCGAMRSDVLSGDMYVFVGRDRRRAKVLYWDGTGLCIYSKRLEKGLFVAPWRQARDGVVRMTVSELSLLLEGCELVGKLALSPAPFEFAQAAARS